MCVYAGESDFSVSQSLSLCLSLPLYVSVISFLFHQAQPGATAFLTKALVKDPTTVAQEPSLLNQALAAP